MNKTQNNSSNSKKQNKEVVVVLCSNRWNSAITEYALSAAIALGSTGLYEVILMGLRESFLVKRAKINKNIVVEEVENFSLSGFWVLKKFFALKKPKHVFAIEGKEYFASCLMKVFGSSFNLYRFVGYNIDLERKYFGLKLQGTFTQAYFFPCEWLLRKFATKGFKNLYQIDLGLNFPKANVSTDQAQRDISEVKTVIRALIFGRLDPVKGHKEFLNLWKKFISFAESTKLKQKFELHIYGREENTKLVELRDVCKSLGLQLEQDVFFRNESFASVPQLMREFDLGIVPSLDSEVILRVAQEFLWNGVPVLVSNVNTLSEVIRSPEDGFVFAYDSGDQDLSVVFTNCLELVVNDSISRKAERSNRAQKIFGIETMASNFLKMMKDR